MELEIFSSRSSTTAEDRTVFPKPGLATGRMVWSASSQVSTFESWVSVTTRDLQKTWDNYLAQKAICVSSLNWPMLVLVPPLRWLRGWCFQQETGRARHAIPCTDVALETNRSSEEGGSRKSFHMPMPISAQKTTAMILFLVRAGLFYSKMSAIISL